MDQQLEELQLQKVTIQTDSVVQTYETEFPNMSLGVVYKIDGPQPSADTVTSLRSFPFPTEPGTSVTGQTKY